MSNKKHRVILSVVLFIVILLASTAVKAADSDLKKLFTTGLDNNLDIVKLENEISILKRNLQLNKARTDWQVDVGVNKLIVEDDSPVSMNSDKIDLSTNKNFLNDKINFSTNASYDFDGTEIIYGVNLNINLFPNIPSESIKNLMNLNNQLNTKLKELYSKKAELVKDWLEKYLQLVNLDENIDILNQRLKIAKDNYTEIQQSIAIDEAGQQKLWEAELILKDAEYNLADSHQQFNQLKKTLLVALQLDQETELILNRDDSILIKLRELTEVVNIDNIDRGQILAQIVKTSSQFAANVSQNEYLKQELKWLKKEEAPEITLQNNYNSEREFSATLNVNYNLFDSGIQDMQKENKRLEIVNNEITFEQLYEQSTNRLDNIINQIELANLNLKRKQLKYDKAVHNSLIASRQYEAGAVEKEVLKNSLLSENSSLAALNGAYDNVFLNKLDILILTQPDEIIKEVTK